MDFPRIAVENPDLRILVTGATGFIGRNLVFELLDRGYTQVHVLARRTSDLSVFAHADIRIVEGDVTDGKSLAAIDSPFDAVVHCAGSVQNADKALLHRVNVEGSRNICEFALRKKVARVVYVSSVAVVSGNPNVPLTEDLPYAATNAYGASKLEGERVAREFLDRGLPMVIVRPPMIYGEDEPHMFDTLMRLLLRGLLFLPNGGRAKLHLCYVRNVAWFLAECLTHPDAAGGTYFVGDPQVLSGAEVFGALADAIGCGDPVPLPAWLTPFLVCLPWVGAKIKFFVKDRVYAIDRMRGELGLVPPYDARTSLAQTARHWFNRHQGVTAAECEAD